MWQNDVPLALNQIVCTRFLVSVLRDVTWYNGFAREVPRPAPIRTGVKAGQYKRTFTGSLHFYELDAATTPLRPSTECRKPSTSSVSLFVSSLFLPVTRTVNSYPILSLFSSRCIFHPPSDIVYPALPPWPLLPVSPRGIYA